MTGRIAIVDDSPGDTYLLRTALHDAGFQDISCYSTLAAAKEALVQAPLAIELILLDARLPDGSGFQLCKWLKTHLSHSLPVIMLTGMESAETRRLAAESGADAHLRKPFDTRILLAHLQRVLKQATGEDQPIERQATHPRSIDGYQVLRTLSWSASSTVYVAEKEGRCFALKLLSAEAVGTPAALRFAEEIQLASSLTHPSLVACCDQGSYHLQPYCVFEYAGEQDLRLELSVSGALTPQRWLLVGSRIAAALQYLHRKNIVHRDITPANVFASGDCIKLGDFGIARQQDAAQGIAGTPQYMAPEQFRGISQPASDVYGFGTTMAHAALGQPPFAAPTPIGMLRQHLTAPLPELFKSRQDLPAEPIASILAAIQPAPEKRPPIGQLADLFERHYKLALRI